MIKMLLLSVCAFAVVPFAQEGTRHMLAASVPAATKANKQATKDRELNVLSNKIESLANLRDYYVAKMTRYRNKASRLEYQGQNFEESKELADFANKLEGIVDQIDEEIARLE